MCVFRRFFSRSYNAPAPRAVLTPPSRIVDPAKGLQTPHFYLHYQGGYDRPLQELVSSLHILLGPASLLSATAGCNPAGREKAENRKKRIGFISSLFGSGEPHGLLLRNVISSLNKTNYEIYVVSVGSVSPLDAVIYSKADEVIAVGYEWSVARRVLEELELDVLVFGEMQVRDCVCMCLFFLRRCPFSLKPTQPAFTPRKTPYS